MTEAKLQAARDMGILIEFDPATVVRCEAQHFQNQPEGYLQWHSWAEGMQDTHEQRQCTFCGLWQVWTPKERTA